MKLAAVLEKPNRAPVCAQLDAQDPIEEATNYGLPDGQEPRTALAARVRLGDDGPGIVFVSMHLYRSAEERLAQEPS